MLYISTFDNIFCNSNCELD